MRLLVTGGAGFIGSAVVRRAIEDGDDVLVFDKLTYAGNLASLAPVAANPRYAFVRADICDRRAVKAALERFRPETVLHLAAESHVDRSIDAPAAFIETNVVGTAVLLEAGLGQNQPRPRLDQPGLAQPDRREIGSRHQRRLHEDAGCTVIRGDDQVGVRR